MKHLFPAACALLLCGCGGAGNSDLDAARAKAQELNCQTIEAESRQIEADAQAACKAKPGTTECSAKHVLWGEAIKKSEACAFEKFKKG